MFSTQQLQLGSSSLFGTQVASRQLARRGPSKSFQPVTASKFVGKKWEHYELNANNKPIRLPVHVKKGDTVQVIAGSEKGKIGEITQVITKTGMVLVSEVNIKTKHVKPKSKEEPGKIIQRESPVHHSNVMHYSKTAAVRSRIGHRINEDGKKVRYLKKTGEVLP